MIINCNIKINITSVLYKINKKHRGFAAALKSVQNFEINLAYFSTREFVNVNDLSGQAPF